MSNIRSQKFLLPARQFGLGDEMIRIHNSCLAEVEKEYPTGCICHSHARRHLTHLAYGPFTCNCCKEKYCAFVQYKNIATRIYRRELALDMVRQLDEEADKELARRREILLFEDVQKHRNMMARCLSDIIALGWRNSTIDDPTNPLPPNLELPDEHIECQAGDYDPFRSPDRGSSDDSYGFKSDADSSDGGVQEMIYSMMRTVQDHLDDTIVAAPQHLEMFRFIEALMFFLLIDLPRAETFAGYSIASYRFLSSVTGKCAIELYHWCIELICDIELPCEPQSGVEKTHTALEKVTQFLKGTMMDKLKKFFFGLTSIGVGRIFSVDIDKSRFEELWSSVGKLFKKSDMICNIFDFIAWLVKNISDYFSGKTTIGKLLFDETDANNFDGRVAALDSVYNVLKTGDQSEYTVQQFAFEIAQLENIANAELVAAKDSKTLRIAISRQLQKILLHKANLQVLSSMRCLRVAPFSVCLVGGTSVGKSCLTSLLVPMLQTACGVASGPEFTFNWDADDKFASGYTSTVTAISIDDLANIQAQFATVQAAELVLFLINNFKRKANMAALEDKGMVNIEPAVVLGSSNDETLGSLVSCCPLSILRRFNYHLSIKVKPCCSVNGMFKVSMDHIPSDHHYDCWIIDIYHYEPDPSNINSNKLYIKTMDLIGASLSDATVFLTNAANKYSTRQKELVEYMNNVHVQPYCTHGIFEHICKICTAVQVVAEPVGEVTIDAPLEQQAGPWPPRISTGLDSPTFVRTLPGRVLIMKAFSDIVGKGVGWHRASKLYVAYNDLCLRPLEWHQVISAGIITGLTAICCAFTVDNLFLAFVSICVAAIVSVITTTVGRIVHTLQMSLPETVCAGMKIIKRKSKKWAKEYGPILLIIGLCSGGYMAMRSKLETQGARASIPLKQECTNKKDGYRTVLVETSDRNRDLTNSTSMDIAEMLTRRIYVGIFTKPRNGSDESTYCNLIPVMSGYWLIPYHVLNEGYTQIRIIRKDSLHLNDSRSAKLDGAWRRIGTTDMCIVALPIMGDQRNIMNLLPSREQHGDRYTVKDTGALLIWAKPTKRLVTDNVTEHVKVASGVEKVNASSELVKIDGLDHPYWGGQYRTTLETWRGMCGSVLITDTPGPTIIGFHSAGVTGKTTSRFCTIMREDVENLIASMCNEGAHVQMAESGDFVKELTFSGTAFLHTFESRPHSTTEYIEGEFTHLGWNTAQKRTFRSSVVETPFAQDVCDKFNIERTHERSPFMNTYVPWNKWLDAASNRSDVPYTILDQAYEDYNHKVHKFWDENPQLNWDNRIHPLAHDAILAGADDVLGCYAMNLNTSAGIPWGKRKRTMILEKDEPVEGITRPLEIDPAIMETVYAAEAKMAKRQRVYFPHRCNLKDEPVKIGKEKVRVFMGSNLTYLYLMRKYFLTLSMLMQYHFDVFESAVGVNAASYEWTQLHDYIFKYSDENSIAGDYGKYDQRFSVKVSLASFKFLIGMLVRAGYTKEQLNCCTVLMTETCIGVYDVNGEWVMFAGLNPSGHGLTVVINGIGNSLYVRCGYYLLKPPNETRLFDELVALMTYGDDNVMSVHDDAPWFNHTSLQGAMAEFGMEYTMADKEADSVPYIPKSKCSFLKRTWVWSEKYGRYLCPIEELSIFKTLTVMKKSEVLTTDQQCAELLSNANREYFFYGEEIFNDRRVKLRDIGVKYGVLHHLAKCDLPTFEELEIWYMSS